MKIKKSLILLGICLSFGACAPNNPNAELIKKTSQTEMGEDIELRNELRHAGRRSGRIERNTLRHKNRKNGQVQKRRTARQERRKKLQKITK